MRYTLEAETTEDLINTIKLLHKLLIAGDPIPESPSPSRDDIEEQMSKIMARSGTDCSNKILASLGATSLVDLPDDKLTDLATALNELEKEK